MWDHIAKPLNVGEMFATIAKWIKPSGPVGAATTATAAASARAGLPPLPGVDLKAGMATTMNNEKLYLRMLAKFRDGQGRFAEMFAAAQLDPDPVAAARAAHTLKGTAGNIGARGVQAAAGDLEQACNDKADQKRVAKILEQVLAELAPVIEGLHPIGGADPAEAASRDAQPPASEGPADADRLQADILRLKTLLEQSDSEAGDLVEALADLAKGSELAPVLKKVAAAVAEFDFDAALAILAKS